MIRRPPFFSGDRPAAGRSGESGNVLFMILTAIVLMGILTAAIQMTSSQEGANIDKESLMLKATQIRDYASELERGVRYVLSFGYSEANLRFAHPDAPPDYGNVDDEPGRQVFSREGGGASYRQAPGTLMVSGAAGTWEFYGGTHLPDVGTPRADLVAVLPNVTKAFCDHINEINGHDIESTYPADTGTSAAGGGSPGECLYGDNVARFDGGQLFYDTPNTTDEDTFSIKPAMQGCIHCELNDSYHFYHVLLTR